MIISPLITLGCDVGLRWIGWAVLDAHLLASGVLDLQCTPQEWTRDAYLRDRMARLIRRYQCRLMALETFHYRGHTTRLTVIPKAPEIDGHIGALLSLVRPGLTLRSYTAAQWMRQVMGYLPRDRRIEAKTWKAQIREQMGLLLNYTWPPMKPSDPLFGHASDAAGIAFVARSEALIFARLKEGGTPCRSILRQDSAAPSARNP